MNKSPRRSHALALCGTLFVLAPLAACAANTGDDSTSSESSALEADNSDTCTGWAIDDGPEGAFSAGDARYIDPYLFQAGCTHRIEYQTESGSIYYAASCPISEVNGGRLNQQLRNHDVIGVAGYTMLVQDPLGKKDYAKDPVPEDYGIVRKGAICGYAPEAKMTWVTWAADTTRRRSQWCTALHAHWNCFQGLAQPDPTCSTCVKRWLPRAGTPTPAPAPPPAWPLLPPSPGVIL
jgi:hypothetical protein